jgi:flagellar L-ring protein precursor FlgH
LAVTVGGAKAGNSSLYKRSIVDPGAAVTGRTDQARPAPAPPVRSLIAAPKPEPKTFAKEDLITIIIREQASHSSSGKSSMSRESSIDAKVDAWVRFHLGDSGMIRPTNMNDGKPAIKADAKREFDGGGSSSRTDTLAARITGKIVDIKPNGNLVLAASKRIATEAESYTITVTGTCRTEDVTADNSIVSTQIAELEITKDSTGAIKDATKRGVLHRLLDWVNVF